MIAEASQDVMMRSALEARKMGLELLAMNKAEKEELEKELAEKDAELAEKDAVIAGLKAQLAASGK